MNQLFYLFPLLILVALVTFKWLSSSSKTHKNPPPSPRKLPLIGNLHQLGSSPHRSLWGLAQKHGPLMLIRLGCKPVLIASSVDAAQEIMKTHDLAFSNRPQMSVPSKLSYGSKDIAFSSYGEYWRQVKSIAVIHLLSNKRVRSYRQVREEETSLMIERIRGSGEDVVNLSELVLRLTNNVVCRVAMGRTYHGEKFKGLLERFLELLGGFSIGSYIPWLWWVDRLSGLEHRAEEVAKEFDEFLEGVLEEHVNKKSGGSDESESKDFVDILLEIQKENEPRFPVHRDTIKAVILDIFAAGTDTTFTNIEWAITELVRHPRVMKKLQHEARVVGQGKAMITEDDLEKMQYLKAVIKETLRLHIPIPLLVPRESTQDVKLMGYDVAAGTQVIINAWAIGRDPSLWEEPEEFRPERFLNNSIDYKGFHFELIPFGAGRRGCPAIQFAIAVNELALANLVYKFDLAVPRGERGEDLDMSETSGLTVHKKSPLLIIATTHSP